MAETIPRPGRRNRDIECLRAVAVLGVVVHHMQGNLFHPGSPLLGHVLHYADFWFGVDLFLAISGFVIARSLLPQMADCGGRLRRKGRVMVAFWVRRVTRLLPSAWFWLAVMLLASVFFNRSHAFQSVHANLMATLAGMFNVAISASPMHFSTTRTGQVSSTGASPWRSSSTCCCRWRCYACGGASTS